MLRKLVVEAIGTFFLVFTVGMVVIDPGAGALAPVAIGSVLMVMVYAGGHISGAHYNPAVSLAIVLRGKSTWGEMIGYWASQVVGALLATIAVGILKGAASMGAVTAASPDVVPALGAEILFTFALVFVILNVATAEGTEGNSYFGLAIGFTVAAGAFAVGGVSGGVFNPAVAIGVTWMGLSAPADIWIFFVANFGAAAAAALLFNGLGMGGEGPR